MVTPFSFEDIMSREITNALPSFKRKKRKLPYEEVKDYELDHYQISPDFGLEMVEIDGQCHGDRQKYAGDAPRTRDLHEAHSVHGNGTPACTLRFFHGFDIIPTVKDCNFVNETLHKRSRLQCQH